MSSPDLLQVGRPALLLIESAGWQAPVIEGPSMVASGGAYYLFYLFYGARDWSTAQAAMGYATCATPLGACPNHDDDGTRPPRRRGWRRTASPSARAARRFFTGVDGPTRIGYHAWTPVAGYPNGGVRSLWVDTVTFKAGR